MENSKVEIGMDVNEVLSTSPDDLRKKVGVAFNEDGEPITGFWIVGKDSMQYRETTNRLRAEGIKRQANKKTRIDTKTEDGAEAFAEILDDNDFELANAVVVDWFGFYSNGTPLPFDKGIARQMLMKRKSWRERISADLENEEGFLKLSSANSAIMRAGNSVDEGGEKTA